ncbi:hypothetical protein [Altererythrobacter sp. MF3-039]|uniref:hypothetical protein n=1 Tax=Altererythrobacter sp. MF3-039 TaxID=3252901 RepID=UPI00390C562C
MITISIAATAAMLAISIWLLVRSPFNIAAIVATLTWIFAAMPAIYYVETAVVPSYSWRNFEYVGGPLSNGAGLPEALGLLVAIGVAFTVGSGLALWIQKEVPLGKATLRSTSPNVTLILALAWFSSMVFLFQLSGWDLGRFLLPVREDFREPGYLLTMFIGIPLAIVAKLYWQNGRLNGWALFWIAIAVMAAFSRSQRRDFVTMALFLIALIFLLRPIVSQAWTRREDIAAAVSRNKIVGLLLLGTSLLLVPVLWYSRVYFNTSAQGQAVDPTAIRSIPDLLLGSPATGFPNFVLIIDYVERFGEQPLHLPGFLLALPIPRALYPGKPEDIDTTLQAQFQLMENPSAFWFGELYFSLGLFAIPAAFLVGFALFRLAEHAIRSPSLLLRTFAAIGFMQSITLFKNGFGQFAINGGTMALFVLFAWYFPQIADRRADNFRRSPRHSPFRPT